MPQRASNVVGSISCGGHSDQPLMIFRRPPSHQRPPSLLHAYACLYSSPIRAQQARWAAGRRSARMKVLLLVAERGAPVMFARIGVVRLWKAPWSAGGLQERPRAAHSMPATA